MFAPNDRSSRLTLSPTSSARVARVVATVIPSATATPLRSFRRRPRVSDSRTILASMGYSKTLAASASAVCEIFTVSPSTR